MDTTPAVAPPLSLEVIEVKRELASLDQDKTTAISADPNLEAQATALVERLLAVEAGDHAKISQAKSAVEDMGVRLQMEAAKKSAMLRTPISTLAKRGDDGGPVANALVELKMNVEALDPVKFDFEPGWLSRTLGFLPFIGQPVKRYFSRYESSQTVLDAIMNSLKDGRETLRRDNLTLRDDQSAMREITTKLEKTIHLGRLIDDHLSRGAEERLDATDPRYSFIMEELLFPLRQRIQDLQQQLVVNQQGVLALELVVRNNKELMRGVDRCINVTINALQVAVTVALALANQKIVLDKVKMVNETTDELIGGTARMLKEQGAAIQKQASSTMLDMDNLKAAFADIRAALDDISAYRRQALPTMAEQIVELDRLAAQQEESIQQMEAGNQQANEFALVIEEDQSA
jgi:uncharacterized protein YaaN involved in tellurite resistance